MSASDAALLAREYATSDRLECRRQNVTGWLRGEEAWDEALAAIAEARPHRFKVTRRNRVYVAEKAAA